MTAAWLVRMGFPDVAVLAGGLPAWAQAGGAAETGHPAGRRPSVSRRRGRRRCPRRLRAAARPRRAPLILDVDQSDVYARGHVPGAVWVCRSRLEDGAATRCPTALDGRGHVRRRRHVDAGRRRRSRGSGYAPVRVLDGRHARVGAPRAAARAGATRLADDADDVVPKPYERAATRWRRIWAGRDSTTSTRRVAARMRCARRSRSAVRRGRSHRSRRPAPSSPPSGWRSTSARRDLRVVDGSWHMPQLKRDPRAEFEEAHVPGAVFFDIDGIADRASALPHMLPRRRRSSRRRSARSASASGDRVVVYDSRGVVSAARVWWTFRAFGHDAVAVLDGGLAEVARRRAAGRERRARRPRRGASTRACGRSSCATSRRCAQHRQPRATRCSTRARAGASPAPSRSRAPGCAAATFPAASTCRTTTLYGPTAR